MENGSIDKTFISERGYGLLKSEYDYKEINRIREELTVSPKSMNSFGNANIPKYKIYSESSKNYIFQNIMVYKNLENQMLINY